MTPDQILPARTLKSERVTVSELKKDVDRTKKQLLPPCLGFKY